MTLADLDYQSVPVASAKLILLSRVAFLTRSRGQVSDL